MRAAKASAPTEAHPPQDEIKTVRLHITPLRPELLKVYLAPSTLSFVRNVSYHTVETFPEKGFGYIDLPQPEAEKLKKKLSGTTLKGFKVRIEMAKSEKRKSREEADAVKQNAEAERPPKRAKKEKRKKEQGVIEGIELPADRKVKRGWTEPGPMDKKGKRSKEDRKSKEKSHEQKASKYTKEPEMLFKAKLLPVAATDVAYREGKQDKKKSKTEKKSKSKEVIVHEFESNNKTLTFLKEAKVTMSKKAAVDYVDGKGWVDEDGNVVEAETGKAKQRRALELVDKPTKEQKAFIDGTSGKNSTSTRVTRSKKAKKTPPPSSSEESSEVSSEDDATSSDSDSTASPPLIEPKEKTVPGIPQVSLPETSEVHPLEALFKRKVPAPGSISTPAKKLTPIDTTFSFFDSEEGPETDRLGVAMDNVPITPYAPRDMEWRGLRSAAPTPDTAAIGRRFSFDWRKGSHEADDDDAGLSDPEAEQQLSHNTKANASHQHLPDLAEEDEEAEEGSEPAGRGSAEAADGDEKPESEFKKWFYENRGDINRAWKKRRRDALKSKRHSENRILTGSRRVG